MQPSPGCRELIIPVVQVKINKHVARALKRQQLQQMLSSELVFALVGLYVKDAWPSGSSMAPGCMHLNDRQSDRALHDKKVPFTAKDVSLPSVLPCLKQHLPRSLQTPNRDHAPGHVLSTTRSAKPSARC